MLPNKILFLESINAGKSACELPNFQTQGNGDPGYRTAGGRIFPHQHLWVSLNFHVIKLPDDCE